LLSGLARTAGPGAVVGGVEDEPGTDGARSSKERDANATGGGGLGASEAFQHNGGGFAERGRPTGRNSWRTRTVFNFCSAAVAILQWLKTIVVGIGLMEVQ